MKRDEFIKFQKEFYEKNMKITKEKNSDYTGASDDPFNNFMMVEYIGICSVEQGFITRMCDKLSRLASIVKKGSFEVKDETIQDTLADLANYCSLFAGYLERKK